MPQAVRRYARAKQLIKLYLHHLHKRQARLQHRRNAHNVLQVHGHTRYRPQSLSSLSEMSSGDVAWSSEISGEENNTSSSDSIHSLSLSSSGSLSDSGSLDESSLASSVHGDAQHLDRDLENEAVSKSDDDDSDQYDGDIDEDSDNESCGAGEDDDIWPAKSGVGRRVLGEIKAMYANRYEAPRDGLPRGPSYLRHVLTVQKTERPDLFRQALRVSPRTFDKIVGRLTDDPIFTNRSNQPQLSVEEQVAIALFRFGHDGNAASLQSVANWAGVGKGTVSLVTRRVMTAVLRPQFMQEAVRMPTEAEKEAAKDWIEAHSCQAWRGGWCMVDGTLVPLADRPYWFGESYFDRKCNYSLNAQV